ncbi:YidC/Oxa1 family membrane protein insertase [Frigoribacterium sp. PvP120]|uniref:membrane protein insertase YidC n=1 Tax=unclassified Frigoribacterium TaxID=2627005 RepID=UPI001AE74581|nr:membrane protein insertase YidC [Frigoribacterium sp. PvP121]MBP1242416.1 YidC/Oxa1 family membrane protein insertase [Frigoribacterium sp. PvP121]
MDLSAFPPVAVVLDGLHSFVALLAALVEPAVGDLSSALAVVLLTVVVRLVLVPVGVSQVRAEIGRRRLAPRVAELTRRVTDPQERSRRLMELYSSEKVSPLAGCLPTLAQAPVLMAVYSLFAHPTIAGHANELLGHTLGGAVLGANLPVALGAGLATVWPYLVLLAVLAVVVELTRRASLRAAGPAAAGAPVPGAPGSAGPATVPGMTGMLRVLPFVSVVFAAFAPLAAALYLVTSASWTLLERAVLRRLLAPGAGGRAVTA